MKYLLLILLLFCNGYSILVSQMMEGVTIADLAEIVVGENVSINNVDAQYNYRSACTYSDAFVLAGEESLLFDGIVLSSGSALALNSNYNTSDHTTLQIGLSPDADLQGLLIDPYIQTYDATYVEFDFVPTITGTMYFSYLFGSDEYFYPHDPLYERYSDIMGIFVNGENIAVLPGTNTPVSVRTVNEYYNSEYFNDNNYDHPIFATEMDGFTDPLTVNYNVNSGESYHLKFGITDANDFSYDSWTLFGKGSLRVEPVNVPEPGSILLTVYGILFLLMVI
jgi:hypothetical protein